MFEHIHFFSHSMNEDSSHIKEDPRFPDFTDKYRTLVAPDSDYRIQGSGHYLLPRPLPEKYMQNLLYIQAFSYMKMGATYYTKRRDFPSFLLLFTYEGGGMLFYENKQYTLSKGDLFLIDCRKEHYYKTCGEYWHHSDLHFFGDFADFFVREELSAADPVFHCAQISVFQQQLENILRHQTSSCTDWAFHVSHEIENLLFLLLKWRGPLTESLPPENLHLLRIYLEQHFQEDMSLEDMAKFSGISKYHLCRQFKKYIGFSPKEYVLDLRISQAKLLLRTSSISGYNICTLVGFSNEANFIRQFKSKTGMTPGQYRKQFL